MAEPYFDTAVQVDLDLLREDVEDYVSALELERIGEEAERDVIQAYTKRGLYNTSIPAGAVEVSSDPALYVMLDGYAEDAVDAEGYDASGRDAWTGFAQAMRRTIAEVVTHRLRYHGVDPTVASEERGRRSEERRFVNPKWPPYWKTGLKVYDLTDTIFVL